MGQLDDILDALLWPTLTTAASLLPRRLSRLIRTVDDGPYVEPDLIA